MSEEQKVSVQVENVLKRIENKDLSSKELINYYNNIIYNNMYNLISKIIF